MLRNVQRLGDTVYDLLVVGSGIYGACVARDAALRGLHVALVDRADFGGATSHNSLKLIHGGLRYLQHLDFPRIRQSLCERRFWLSMAPHLVRPLKFVIPTYGRGSRGPEALWLGMKLHEVIGFDRNKAVSAEKHIPAGRIISSAECLQMIPHLESKKLRGGAIWYDGQMLNADRLLLECVMDSAESGADVANYVRVENFLQSNTQILGVQAIDVIHNQRLEIRAKVTINACGPWVSDLLGRGNRTKSTKDNSVFSKGMNLVTRQLFKDYAVGVYSNEQSDAVIGQTKRLFFMTPWSDRTVIGTSHTPYHGRADDCQFTEDDIAAFVEEVNAAYPSADLRLQDVLYCYGGLTPAEDESNGREVARARSGEIIDHQRSENVENLISIVGVKYTTARYVAEKAVDLAFRKLRKTPAPCTAKQTPVGDARKGPIASKNREIAASSRNRTSSKESRSADVQISSDVRGTDNEPDPQFRARCVHAVRDEMAVRLVDVIYRRTDDAARGNLRNTHLVWCADMMSKELGWTNDRKRQELEHARMQQTVGALKL
ncbi:MAG: glycerol-3-phosphate dehydrogenase/oxidase [Gammaproteobacteria bacterium]